MATTTIRCSGETAARIAAALAGQIRTHIQQAERDNVKTAKEAAVAQSSGTATSKDLARAGHPFALAHPDNSVDPAVVNDPTGQFKAGWKAQEPRTEGDTITSAVTNDSPAAKWIATGGQGDSKMVARPIVQAVANKVRPKRKERVRRGVREAVSGAVRKGR